MHQPAPPTAERREGPRVPVPLEVELDHPSLGRRRCRVRNLSADGLFLELVDAGLARGARLRLTPVAEALLGHEHCPWVEVEVVHSEADGVGARFANRTQAFLFNSFQQRRSQLAVGSDYFQVYVAALATDPAGQLLLVEEQGRWLFPGAYLVVGQDIEQALSAALRDDLGLEWLGMDAPLAAFALDGGLAPEAAALALFHACRVRGEPQLRADGRYRRWRWLKPGKEPSDLVFADARLRTLAGQVLLP